MKVVDYFIRQVPEGWGDTPSGRTWHLSGGTNSDRSVTTGAARVTLTDSPGTIRAQSIPQPWGDGEILAQFVAGQVSETESVLVAAVFRRRSGNDYYRARVVLGTDGTVGLDVTRGVTQVGSRADTGITYTPGFRLWVRARVDGHRVRARVWLHGTPEPTTWGVDRTITTAPIPVGDMGLMVSAFAGNTNVDPWVEFQQVEITYPTVVENRLHGTPNNRVSDTTLGQSADMGTVTITSPGDRARYDQTETVHGLATVRIQSGHHRKETPQLRVNLPPSGPWAARWYTWMPRLQDAGHGNDEVRTLAVLPTHAWTVHPTAAGNVGTRLQTPDLAAPPLRWDAEAGSSVATGQWWRCELAWDGTSLTSRVYPGHATTGARVHTWRGLGDPGRTLDLTGYRWRRRPTLRKGDQGSAVAALQNELVDLGYDIGGWGADGQFGTATRDAVLSFQGDYGLSPVDGEAGPETRAALDLALGRVPPALWVSHLVVTEGLWPGPAEPVPVVPVRRSRLVVGLPI